MCTVYIYITLALTLHPSSHSLSLSLSYHSNTNIFLSLSDAQWRESRKVILTAILGTDMSHHFEQISKIQLFLEVNKDDIHDFCAGACLVLCWCSLVGVCRCLCPTLN